MAMNVSDAAGPVAVPSRENLGVGGGCPAHPHEQQDEQLGGNKAVRGEEEIRRFKVVVAFDGSDFHGWQRHPGVAPTVQGVIEGRLQRFFGTVQRALGVVVNGRTDAGVHARAAVFHLDVPVLSPESCGRSELHPSVLPLVGVHVAQIPIYALVCMLPLS